MEGIYKKALIKSQNVNFSFFINMALNSEITWIELGNILEDLTPTFDKSKQLNKVFLKEFEALQSLRIESIQENGLDSFGNDDKFVKDEELYEHDEEYDESLGDNEMIEADEEKLQTDAEETSVFCKIVTKSF